MVILLAGRKYMEISPMLPRCSQRVEARECSRFLYTALPPISSWWS